jgi:uncharacterized protein YjfI (DUF2170 family)
MQKLFDQMVKIRMVKIRSKLIALWIFVLELTGVFEKTITIVENNEKTCQVIFKSFARLITAIDTKRFKIILALTIYQLQLTEH